MKVGKSNSWQNNIIVAVAGFVAFIIILILLNGRFEYKAEFSAAIMGMALFFMSVCQFLFCLYNLFFVEDKKTLGKIICVLLVLCVSLLEYFIGIKS